MSWRRFTPPLRRLARGYVVPAKAKPIESQAPQISKVANGFLVGSIETYAPVCHVFVAVGAGSRHEKGHERGASHAVRVMSNIGTLDATGFGISRVLDLCGSNLETISTREETIYHLQTTRNQLEKGLSCLGQVATHQVFKPWEVENSHNRLRLDLEHYRRQNFGGQLVELAHEAAFRDEGLGRSIYCAPQLVDKLLNGILIDFVDENFTVDRTAVLGLGVDHDELANLVVNFFDGSRSKPAPSTTPSKFYGGRELRHEDGGQTIRASMVAEGAPKSSREAAACAVLAKILGGAPHSKYSSNTTSSRLHVAVTKAAGGEANAVSSAFAAAYSDAGLIGVNVFARADCAHAVIEAALAEAFRAGEGDISDEDVERAIRQVKAEVAMNAEVVGDLGKSMVVEMVETQQIPEPLGMAFEVEKVTKSDVVSVAKKLQKKRENWSMALMGGVGNAPYVEDFF